MSDTLGGKRVVISGASHGLGLALARRCAELGAEVIGLARDGDRLEAAMASLRSGGGRATALPCDVSERDRVESAAREIADRWERVDALVNNAAIPAPRTFEDTDFDDWDRVIATDLSGVFYLTRALWPLLTRRAGGYVITVSGTAGLRGGGSPAYGAAKSGLTGLVRAIAGAGKAHGLRATVLYPGSMDTGWRGAPIGEKPRSESMDPAQVGDFIAWLLASPSEFSVDEAVLNPSGEWWR